MKLGVFGNCQSNGMADSLRALAPGADVFRFGIPQARECSPDKIAEIMEIFSNCDAVFIQPSVRHTIDGMRAEDFAARCKRVIPYPLIASRVAHPDCHYVVDRQGKQVVTPLGPYHSAIALGAYLERLDIERTRVLFNRFTYCSLSYDKITHASEVVAAESLELGYDFGAFFEQPNSVYMHTINHPRIDIIFETARQGLAKLGITPDNRASPPEDKLRLNTVWPVYPGLFRPGSEETEPIFTHAARKISFTLEEFLTVSYASYETAEQPLKSAPAEKVRAFSREFVVL